MYQTSAETRWNQQLESDISLRALAANPLLLELPDRQLFPIVLSATHSGAVYPSSFVEQSLLDAKALRRSEDCFMDQVGAEAAQLGVPLVAARFPRVMLDPNREALELDPKMFEGRAPFQVRSDTPRVKGGLGTIARSVGVGRPVYRSKLSWAEASWRIENFYHPYHEELRSALERTRARFGFAILLDLHSMPSAALLKVDKYGVPDIVLGDRFGRSCARAVISRATALSDGLGYFTVRNAPYAGGYITQHYGQPRQGVHALQLEVNRALYMDEARFEPTTGIEKLKELVCCLVEDLAKLDLASQEPLAAE